MRVPILFHPQLRSSLPRPVRRELCSSLLSIRPKSTQSAPRIPKSEHTPTNPSHSNKRPPRTYVPPAGQSKSPIRKGPPEKILIYHGGTGRTMFLGMLRITTIFVFGVSCVLVAPAFMSSEFPSYLGPAIIAGGALPMLFVAYTAAPYVNFVHLALPISVRRSREQAIEYAKKLPPTATLYINTMKFSTIPRQTEVRFGNLVPDKSTIRPVTFKRTNPEQRPWWMGKPIEQFYTAGKSNSGTQSSTFYPEIWEHVYKQIRAKPPKKSH
ncbi:hypothetical protein BJY04DRAFT_179995 [Aspergillus karnatakaensis]|uniref:uncharacterized protein n=1 Tax=Aspergillus karnatakaensis TaxID=1810916 RepID=UPI003CCCCC94